MRIAKRLGAVLLVVYAIALWASWVSRSQRVDGYLYDAATDSIYSVALGSDHDGERPWEIFVFRSGGTSISLVEGVGTFSSLLARGRRLRQLQLFNPDSARTIEEMLDSTSFILPDRVTDCVSFRRFDVPVDSLLPALARRLFRDQPLNDRVAWVVDCAFVSYPLNDDSLQVTLSRRLVVLGERARDVLDSLFVR